MNLVFYLIVIISFILLWFVLAFIFKPVGRFLFRLWDDVQKTMNEDE